MIKVKGIKIADRRHLEAFEIKDPFGIQDRF
jgi:hypothetical protein